MKGIQMEYANKKQIFKCSPQRRSTRIRPVICVAPDDGCTKWLDGHRAAFEPTIIDQGRSGEIDSVRYRGSIFKAMLAKSFFLQKTASNCCKFAAFQNETIDSRISILGRRNWSKLEL